MPEVHIGRGTDRGPAISDRPLFCRRGRRGDPGGARAGRRPWAEEAASTIAAASPLSLKITFRELRLGVSDLKAALALEYRLTQHILASGDFFEGVRAALVDKDRGPRWRHQSPAQVSPEEVEGYFAEFGDRELIFP